MDSGRHLVVNDGGRGGSGWALDAPQNKEKKIEVKKKKNVKFGSNLSHLVPSQKSLALFLDFMAISNKFFWPYSQFFGLYPLSFYFYFWFILSNAHFFSL